MAYIEITDTARTELAVALKKSAKRYIRLFVQGMG
jgi:Fe-S cluster assembly iron-binding protein IscA